MSKIDSATKDYISDGDIFADVVNYYLYGGEQVIDPASLKPLDTSLLLHIFREIDGASEGSPSGEKSKEISEAIQRYRDVIRQTSVMVDNHCAYVIVGLEAQTLTHYAMPVRSIVYDGLQYAIQVEKLREKHKQDGDKASHAEFLSGMHKEDRLVPVITICLHFGTEPWNGALSLMDLLDVSDERLLPYVQDYRTLLIEPARMNDEDFDKFSTSLGQVLRFMKEGRDKRKLAELMDGDDTFKSLDRKAARVIRYCANVNIQIREDEEVVNVCKGWYDAIEDAANAARLEEREAAQEREEKQRKAAREREIHSVMDTYRECNIPEVEIRQRIIRKYSLNENDIDRYLLAANA
ncbi:MAG: Rpn family recombination-promoting nuclease/putative transposase [Lachnospiraceae bacterium]|nr:Rpn family recombination-promoting nuclease/putative transposase [Lachnospiraceae bacterium]